MGGPHLTIPCTLSYNGYAVQLPALADSGANGFSFINTPCAVSIAKFLNLKARRLPQPIHVKGYNGQVGSTITHLLKLHLTVDGRRQYNIPLLILDLGSHDLILGRKWFAYFNVLIDTRHRRLLWPAGLQPSYSVVKEITVDRKTLLPRGTSSQYQEDIDQRERAFEAEDRRRAAGRISAIQLDTSDESDLDNSDPPEVHTPTHAKRKAIWRPTLLRRTHQGDTRQNLQRMESELKSSAVYAEPVSINRPLYQRKPFVTPEPTDSNRVMTVDIAGISAEGTHFNMRRADNEAFTTSLYEIDRILGDKQAKEDDLDEVD